MITLFFGCSMETTHKTLTFFLDGVDRVNFFNSYLSNDSLRKESVTKREALLKKNRPDRCVHKPYKEKKCDECHTPDKRLLMPMPELCYKCHKSFNESYAVIHGPVASGNCTNCHNQHSSTYPKLLIRPGQQLCLYCHNSSLIFASKVHKEIEDAECTLCHSPHGGKTRFMIKDHIPRDPGRIALLEDLTYRHLYGQVFCKTPGDVNNILEIYIIDAKGALVSTAHPDANGKFYLSNLHPNQNYIFKFKNEVPDCKINIMDVNGTIL
jgi:predicted CXXCH cytochrome family protein